MITSFDKGDTFAAGIVLERTAMKAPGKTVMTKTFGEYEMALIEKAASIVMKHHNRPELDEFDRRKNYRRIIRLAVLAYTRGVIEGGLPHDVDKLAHNLPMIATGLRLETQDEMEARCKGEIPGEAVAVAFDWKAVNRWN